MMTIEVEHNGYTIRYYEDGDLWMCGDLQIEAKSLKAAKAAINKVNAEARRITATRIIKRTGWGGVQYGEVTSLTEDGQAWVMIRELRNKPPVRRKVRLEELLLDTPEARKLLGDYDAIVARHKDEIEAVNSLIREHIIKKEQLTLPASDEAA